MDSDDEEPVLSSSALEALKEFYADRDARQKQFEDLKARAEKDADGEEELSMNAFAEDWNESQFWYSKGTATDLAEELLKGADGEKVIAVVSAPSVFIELKNILAKSGKKENERPKIHLLEFDERFGVFPEFSFYDFNSPLKLPVNLKGTVDHVIVDPPFLSEECQSKTATTVEWLCKSWGGAERNGEASKLIVCTGERMENVVKTAYATKGLATTTYLPVHAKGLSNEFFCYANFECDKWRWKVEDS